MRGLSMVNSYSIIVMGWGYVRYGFPRSWLILTLLANVALSLVLAAHIDSRRGRCTVPVEAELVLSEVREIPNPPSYRRGKIQWAHDVWRFCWGGNVCFAEDTIPPLMCLFGPLVGIRRSGTIWVDPSRSPYASYGGVLSPDWRYHLRFYFGMAAFCLLAAVALAGSAPR